MTVDTKLLGERNSNLVVILVVVIVLLFGWNIKTSYITNNRTTELDGAVVIIPAGWITSSGSGEIVFVAEDPISKSKYVVQKVDPRKVASLLALVEKSNSSRGALLELFRVLEQTEVIVEEYSGYKVTYSYISLGKNENAIPEIIQGLDYYFESSGGDLLIITLISPSNDFDAELNQFKLFRDSVLFSSSGGE